ncbi:unnamed protein product [Paramecium sonneborni]|uniref:Uncharacterized protein n=1 Tax=Paramecium sonneborni TaxID=65129 RepID=A0A8S1QRJ8_9CILI|nr:unnamed protein product [Paramecium sonneborni]
MFNIFNLNFIRNQCQIQNILIIYTVQKLIQIHQIIVSIFQVKNDKQDQEIDSKQIQNYKTILIICKAYKVFILQLHHKMDNNVQCLCILLQNKESKIMARISIISRRQQLMLPNHIVFQLWQ